MLSVNLAITSRAESDIYSTLKPRRKWPFFVNFHDLTLSVFARFPLSSSERGLPESGKSENGKNFQITAQEISADVVKTWFSRPKRDNLGKFSAFCLANMSDQSRNLVAAKD